MMTRLDWKAIVAIFLGLVGAGMVGAIITLILTSRISMPLLVSASQPGAAYLSPSPVATPIQMPVPTSTPLPLPTATPTLPTSTPVPAPPTLSPSQYLQLHPTTTPVCADYLPDSINANVVQPTPVLATTLTWSATSPTSQIAKETVMEYKDFYAGLPQKWKVATPLTFQCGASNRKNHLWACVGNPTLDYPKYLKTYLQSPNHYFLREYVAWRLVREGCRAQAFSHDPRYAPFAGTLTDEGHLIMIVSPQPLNNALDFAEFAVWLYKQDVKLMQTFR